MAPPGADLSLLSLFLQADVVVKLVMVVLLIASIWVWTIIIEKIVSLRRVNRSTARAPTRPIPSPPCSVPR
jgi:biopolymer transport protein TolQ